ncbi:hypothetical protein BD779DRAFT_1806556 [Infundibulicybe gibba]|nr:hypothetical protein BD779DRAFT_1806556 [Infundibulicybe gibba]
MEDKLLVESIGGDALLSADNSSTAVIKSLFGFKRPAWHPGSTERKSHVRRDIIAVRYLHPSVTSMPDQVFAFLEHLIRILNSSDLQIPSLERLTDHWRCHKFFSARGVERAQLEEVIWQRAILFRNLLSKEQWKDSAGIHMERVVCMDTRSASSGCRHTQSLLGSHGSYTETPRTQWSALAPSASVIL